MDKKTERQIIKKTTWTKEDQAEFEDALGRKRSESTQRAFIRGKAKALTETQPEAAVELLKRIKPSNATTMIALNDTLAMLELSLNRRDDAFAHFLEHAQACLAAEPPRFTGLEKALIFAVTHGYEDKFGQLLDMLDASNFKTLDPTVKHGEYPRHLFWGACYMAETRGEMDRARSYEEFALLRPLSYPLVAPEYWRFWLFKKHRIGAESYCGILAQPGFELQEMRDWAETSFLRHDCKMYMEDRDGALHFSMIWDDAAIQISEKGKVKGMPYGFTKAMLKGFPMENTSLLSWSKVGDFDDVYVNHAIEVLAFIETDERLRDSLKR